MSFDAVDGVEIPAGEWVAEALPAARTGCHLSIVQQGIIKSVPDRRLGQADADEHEFLTTVSDGRIPECVNGFCLLGVQLPVVDGGVGQPSRQWFERQ